MSKNSKITNEVIVKNNVYKDDDSGKVFIIALIAPFVLALLFSFVASSIAQAKEIESSVITGSLGYEIAYCICSFILYVAIFFIYNKSKNISYKASQINFKMKWQIYLLIIVIGVISLLGIQYFIGAIDHFLRVIKFPVKNDLSTLTPTNWGTYFLAVLVAAVFPAIHEELIFRGMIFQGLRSRFNDYIAIVLSALMFALMHMSLQQLIYPFLLGCIMGWIVLRTGSLISSILVHFINNFLVITFTFIKNMTGFSMDLPGKWWFYIIAILLLIATFGIYYLIDRFYFKHKTEVEREKTSKKTSIFVYFSFGVAGFLYLIATITTIVSAL